MLVPSELIDFDYMAPGHLGPTGTFLLDITLLGVGLGSILFVMWFRARELKAFQHNQQRILVEKSERPLSRGPQRAVYGRVESDVPHGAPVQLKLVQKVVAHSSKNRRWYEWEETSRTVSVTPFYVVQADGQAVFVEPDDDVLIVDSLETEHVEGEKNQRTQTSSISNGEMIFVYGDLHEGAHPRAASGYRDGGTGWIMRPPRRTRMLLATSALSERYAKRITFLRQWTLIAAGVWAFFHLFVTLPFAALALAGKQTEAIVRDQHAARSSGKSREWHYWIIAQSGGAFCTEEVRHFTYESIEQRRSRGLNANTTVPMLHAGNLFCRFGTQPTAPGIPIFIGLFVSSGAIFLGIRAYRKRFPWYDMKKLVEYGGEGVWKGPQVK